MTPDQTPDQAPELRGADETTAASGPTASEGDTHMQPNSSAAVRLVLDEMPNGQPASAPAPGAEVPTIATLSADLQAAHTAASEAERLYQQAWAAACELHPPLPEEVADTRFPNVPAGREDLMRRDRAEFAAALPRGIARSRIETLGHWERQCEAINLAFRVDDLQEAVDQTWNAVERSASALERLRPANARELALKYAAIAKLHANDGDESAVRFPFDALVEDLEALAAAEPSN